MVLLRDPSGLAKLRGTEQSGNLSAVSKSITRSFLQEMANKVPRTFLFASMHFDLVLLLIVTLFPVSLNSLRFSLEIGA